MHNFAHDPGIPVFSSGCLGLPESLLLLILLHNFCGGVAHLQEGMAISRYHIIEWMELPIAFAMADLKMANLHEPYGASTAVIL